MKGLESLNDLVVSNNKPTNLEMIYYLFWKKGIDINQFNKLPLPYIFSIINTHGWVKEKEQQANKGTKK